MTRWLTILIVLGAFAFPPTAAALGLSMEGAVQAALMGNPTLIAARFEAAKAHGRLLQAGLMPNPEFEFSGMSDVAFGAEGENSFTVGIAQQFPLTARLSLARQVRRVEVAQALREIRNGERLLVARVQGLYVKVQAARLRQKVAAEARESSMNQIALMEKRVAAGQGSLAETALLRVDERRWWNAARSAKTDAEVTMLELKTAVGLPADQPLELTQSLDAVVTTFQQKSPTSSPLHRPDVELALLEIDRAGAEVRLARAEAWEGITIGAQYTYDHAVDEPAGLNTGQFLGIRVSLPLPVWDDRRGAVTENKALRDQAVAKVRALELEIGNSIATATRRVELFQQQFNDYRSGTEGILRQNEKELSAAYEQGRVDLSDLLQLRAQSATLRVESVTLRENVALALIDLQATTGNHPAISLPYTQAKSSLSKKKP